MCFKEIKKLQMTDLTVEKPIIQGGMGVGISLSGLASAVANEGGIGVIACAMPGIHEPDIATNRYDTFNTADCFYNSGKHSVSLLRY